MTTVSQFPKQITVSVKHPLASGLAVVLCFEMSRKNNYDYIVFLDSNGSAVVSAEELLRAFDENRSVFIMDYVEPRSHFAGQVKAWVLSNDELRSAVSAFELFRNSLSYPQNYEINLRAAASHGQKPDEYIVKVKIE